MSLSDDVKRLSDTLRQCVGDDGAVACVYQGAVAFVSPSWYAEVGRLPLAALSQGCMVICR